MPRRASAGGALRSATRLSAPSGSPPSSKRAAAGTAGCMEAEYHGGPSALARTFHAYWVRRSANSGRNRSPSLAFADHLGQILHRTYLNNARLQTRMLGHQLNGVVQVRGFNDAESAQLFFGLGIRTV